MSVPLIPRTGRNGTPISAARSWASTVTQQLSRTCDGAGLGGPPVGRRQPEVLLEPDVALLAHRHRAGRDQQVDVDRVRRADEVQVVAARPDQGPDQRHRQPRAQAATERDDAHRTGPSAAASSSGGPLVGAEVEGRHCAVIPPSGVITAPVTNAASSLARNSATFAMSSGLPSRPIGYLTSGPGQAEVEVAVAAGAQHRFHQRGVDGAGTDDVDPDPARRQVDGHRAGERDDRALGRAVGREVRHPDQRGDRALVDDRAARRAGAAARPVSRDRCP